MSLLAGFGFSQAFWPGALADGKINDCWILAALRAVHAAAPWEPLVGVVAFRAAADKQGPGNVGDIMAGLRVLYPKVAAEPHTAPSGYSWSAFMAELKTGRVAEVLLNSGKLPASHQFGYAKDIPLNHAVTVAWEAGAIQFANPLAKPHAKAIPITEAALKAAVTANDWNAVSCVFMPTEAEAFTTHPLYVPPLKWTTLGAGIYEVKP